MYKALLTSLIPVWMMEPMTAGKEALVRLFGRKAWKENRQKNKEEIKRGKQRERKKEKHLLLDLCKQERSLALRKCLLSETGDSPRDSLKYSFLFCWCPSTEDVLFGCLHYVVRRHKPTTSPEWTTFQDSTVSAYKRFNLTHSFKMIMTICKVMGAWCY